VKPTPDRVKTLLAEQAARVEEKKRELAIRSFREFAKQAWQHIPGEGDTPLIWNWHMDIFCDELESLVRGNAPKRNLLINVPPGSGKSSFVAVMLLPWVWLWWPEWTTLFISGAEDVSMRDSMKCRGLMASEWYRGFGCSWKLTADQNAKGWYRNTKGGERQATTIGSKGTGKRVHAVFFDDPNDTKDTSETKLQDVTDSYRYRFQNRLKSMKTGIRVLIQQRTHMKDLTGWLLANDAEAWSTIVIRQEYEPGDAEAHPMDPRTDAGELFFPERDDAIAVESQRGILGPVGFAGQHQQRPIPATGGTIKVGKIIVEEVAPAGIQMCRGWDAGATEGGGDWTVGALLGRDSSGIFWILDIARKQTGEPRAFAKQTAGMDGFSVPISWPQDPGQAGKDQAQSMVRDFAGWSFTTSPETGAKRTRWEPFAAQVNGGNVRMVRAAWNRVLIDEMETDGQVHDDQLDALARAFTHLTGGPTGLLDYMRAKAGR
jgi:predicted phage terminase large subunit-like protein